MRMRDRRKMNDEEEENERLNRRKMNDEEE